MMDRRKEGKGKENKGKERRKEGKKEGRTKPESNKNNEELRLTLTLIKALHMQ